MASIFNQHLFKADSILLEFIYNFAGYKKENLPTLRKAVKRGDLAMETLVENAVALTGKHKRVDKQGQDLSDGSEVKKSTVRNSPPNKKTANRFAEIGNMKNKTGLLRVVVVEPKEEEVYLFKIPHKVYSKMISKRGNIRINFSIHGGKPKTFMPGSKQPIIWQYQVKNFKELSK